MDAATGRTEIKELSDLDRFQAPSNELPVVAHCAYCRNEIRWGDEVTVIGGGDIVDAECERDYINARLIAARGIIGLDGDVE